MREETGDIEPLLMRLANVPRVGGATTSNDNGENARGDWPAVLVFQTVGRGHQSSLADYSASTLELAVHQELSLPRDLVLLGVHAAHNPIHELRCVRFSSHSQSTLEVIQL